MKRLLTVILVLVAAIHPCMAEDVSTDRTRIEEDVDRMLSAMRGKFSLQPHADRITEHGDAAVPALIDRHSEVAEEKRWALVACLCRLPTPESRKFLMAVIQQHADRKSTSYAIRHYPIQHDGDITEILINLLAVQHHRWNASERLSKVILRHPPIAGQLVDNLTDHPSSRTRNQELREILEHVSGYKNTTLSSRWFKDEPPPTSHNDFWRVWWQRNMHNDVFAWLSETLRWKHGGRRSYPLQVMGTLEDERAIPIFVEALNDKDYGVRYYAVVGLQKLDGTYPAGGYASETFKKEEDQIIVMLKARFGNKTDKRPDAGDGF
jgi:hypothetical protein